MGRLSRREWVDLLLAHPCPDPADPSDEFAQALLAATGQDPAVWETGTESEALEAYRAAWGRRPDASWAKRFLTDHPEVHAEVKVCTDHGIPYAQFLAWDELSQDLLMAAALLDAETCPYGHSKELQVDEEASEAVRTRCAACAKREALDKRVARQMEAMQVNAEDPARMGWTTRVVPR